MSRIRVIMPKMGMTMTEGSVASWEKHDGDHVHEGEVIAMVETDKITNSLESPATGKLHTTQHPREDLPGAARIGYIEVED